MRNPDVAPNAPAEALARPVAPAQLPEDPELRWLYTTYRWGERQLTVRAVITGMVLGGIMCLSNLSVVPVTGWSMGVTLTACMLACAIFRGLKKMRLVTTAFPLLENDGAGSVASAAG